MKELGILKNAKNVGVELRTNEVSTASFTLPANDSKNDLCTHFNFVDFYGKSGRFYGTFRIMPRSTRKNSNTNEITYSCEHVFATLLDDIMDGYHQFTNWTTTEVLEYILSLQDVQNFVLGTVDFTKYFHYSFENENGLLAPILSIPQPFNEPYEFTFDTSVYPWKLNLISSSSEVKSEIREGKNLIDFEEYSNPEEIVNYIIPKGSGEGVNQLTIADVNNGSRFLYDQDSIDLYGKKKYIWIDKRFDDAQALKDSAQSLLDQWKQPKLSFPCTSADLSVLKGEAKNLLNTVTRIYVGDTIHEARLINERRPDILLNEHNVSYDVNSRLDDIATTQTDLKRKQQVNEAYSQGATNIMVVPAQDNADSTHPLVIPFVIDDDVVNVNTCELWLRTKAFRAYSEATGGGGATVKSTSSGGGTSTSTSSGGGTSKSTSSGGGSVQSSGLANGWETTLIPYVTGDDFPYFDSPHKHGVTIDLADFQHHHTTDLPAHTHDFDVPNHTHDFAVPAHTHDIDLPDHTHDINHGIYELNETPSNVTIKVDGNTVSFSGTSGDRIDLIDYIGKDSDGKITRGRHEIELLPNDLARIEAELIFRVFIRSHIGGNY
ncbi:phage tail spike protein [Halolactibacillus miurensis]|nr:phage tail spike protein [Halolactibacillus miurensis]